jgi:alpha-glucosidase (family GH31 glycosyl hydrolase)
MYPEITPLIRDAIKRRYELIPYLYSLMLISHRTAYPPQRWIGHGFESDPEVWTSKVMRGETQYWLGDSLMVGGVYEAGETTAKMYLPTSGEDDLGYLNLNAPYQHLAAGQWVTIDSEWRHSIPLLAHIGGAIPIGKNVQTRAPGDHKHPSPNVFEDDYRAVEIFPPKGSTPREKVFSNTWYEDDGIAAKPEISAFTVKYGATKSEVRVQFEKDPRNKYTPVWKDLHVILPVGDERTVTTVLGGSVVRVGSNTGRNVFKIMV